MVLGVACSGPEPAPVPEDAAPAPAVESPALEEPVLEEPPPQVDTEPLVEAGSLDREAPTLEEMEEERRSAPPPDPAAPAPKVGEEPPIQQANLAPEHLEQAEWDAMSDREKRAARAAAARNAYQPKPQGDGPFLPDPEG